jgi:iron(III) transport system permease protein
MTDRTGAIAPPASVLGPAAKGLSGEWLAYLAAALSAVVLLLFIAYPIGKTLFLAFIESGKAPGIASLTFGNFRAFFTSPLYQEAFVHTLTVSLAATALAVVVAVPAAYAVARIDLPLRGVALTLAVLPLISPPFIGAYAWIVLLGKRGVITQLADMWLGIDLPTIYGPIGITLALVLHFYPYAFLFTHAALSAADPHIEEAGEVMGASRLKIIWSITLPLTVPSIAAGALLVFTQSLGNFGVPSVLGKDYMTLPTLLVYNIYGKFNLNAAAAIGLINVLLTIGALLLVRRYSRRGRYVTVTSTSRAIKRNKSLGAKLLGGAYVWLLLAISLAPLLVVVAYSFVERWPGTLWPTLFGMANYEYLFDRLVDPMLASLYLAAVATIACVLFGTLTAYAAARPGFFAKPVLDLTIMLPFVIPGLITGLAFLAAFNSGFLVLSGTAAIIILAYFVRKLAYTFRSVTAALNQLDGRIEEASTICGARWGETMRRIIVPLVAPGILAGGILVFATLIMDLSITILLYSANWKTLAIVMYEQLFDDKVGYASAAGTVGLVVTSLMIYLASRLVGRSMSDMFR